MQKIFSLVFVILFFSLTRLCYSSQVLSVYFWIEPWINLQLDGTISLKLDSTLLAFRIPYIRKCHCSW